METLEDFLRERVRGGENIFVFPSEVTASLWTRRLLQIDAAPTIPLDRIISWDRFKEKTASSYVKDKKPASAVLRKLFASRIIAQNAERRGGLFLSLIPPEYAARAQHFCSWIAAILPQLETWRRAKPADGLNCAPDPFDKDLLTLSRLYNDFLDAHNLFEPSWIDVPLKNDSHTYYIIFPELTDDFYEYKASLEKDGRCVLKSARDFAPPESVPPLNVYKNSLDEIKETALRIEYLLSEKKIPPNAIAVSLPSIKNAAPYVLRELSLRGIPYDYRAADELASLPAGRMFTLIKDCVSCGFSFETVKALLLNRLIPWRDTEKTEGLIAAGIACHCVTPWKENGVYVDVWDRALSDSSAWNGDPVSEHNRTSLLAWYRKLRKTLSGLVGAKRFADVRANYFAFKESFLDADSFSREENLIIARCVEELSLLTQIESSYPDLTPEKPYDFFIAHIAQKKYAVKTEGTGVCVFPYQVAAGSPFYAHFILGAAQEQTTVLYKTLDFLSYEKRAAFNIAQDRDVSADFIRAYAAGCTQEGGGLIASYAEQTFDGYRTPQIFFSRTAQNEKSQFEDPFRAESELFANPDACFKSVYPAQKLGFSKWERTKPGDSYSLNGDSPLARDSLDEYMRSIGRYIGDRVKISQTDLNDFNRCRLLWFFKYALNISEFSPDAVLIDEKRLGSILHTILRALYSRIKKNDGRFLSARMDDYSNWLLEEIKNAASSAKEYTGPMAAPLIAVLTDKMYEQARRVLEADALYLDGWKIEAMENRLQYESEDCVYVGIIDRISSGADGATLILDYKTGRGPERLDCFVSKRSERSVLNDFQIPMYVFLAENSIESPIKNRRVDNAFFFKTKEAKFLRIVQNGAIADGPRAAKGKTREEFDEEIALFKQTADSFKNAVRNGVFRGKGADKNGAKAECPSCFYKQICRATYPAQGGEI